MPRSPSSFARRSVTTLFAALVPLFAFAVETPALRLNDGGYFELPGLNVMVGSDYYPDGHQGGVGIIQNGERTATNGDLRLEPTPGQWQPMPKVVGREVDASAQEIRLRLAYPDEKKNRTGFNPIDYPDLNLAYTVRVTPAGGNSFRIIVDLDQPLPTDWVGRVGFNLELYPGILFGKTFRLGEARGIFPREAIGPGTVDPVSHTYQLAPLAGGGRELVIAPESDAQRLAITAVRGGELALLDGRAVHNNGWFVVRAAVAGGATKNALEWLVTPHAIPGWRYAPVVQVSQVGYHPAQSKVAVVELDARDEPAGDISLLRIDAGGYTPVLTKPAAGWGAFLRYRYARFDFSEVRQEGMYVVRYGGSQSSPFAISGHVYQHDVWQPTLETFLPVQMCHMRVDDRYRVWHGLCHVDDALMAPVNHNHFDGYAQGPSTLTRFQPGEHVPGLDRGGWHDAGDYDLRVESQADTVHGLALAWELFHPAIDNTTVDQERRVVTLFQPDGKPDLLQQVAHGVLSIVGGYQSMGRLYRGIQDATLRQYTHLGDAATMTDNLVFKGDVAAAFKVITHDAIHGVQTEPALAGLPPVGSPGAADDRWVFTENNPDRELNTAAALAAAARVLRGYNDPLADDCRRIAEELWAHAGPPRFPLARLAPAIDLLQTTGEKKYADAILALTDEIVAHIAPEDAGGGSVHVVRGAWLAARSLALIPDASYREKIRAALQRYRTKVDQLAAETPYGIPYQPDIWGAGWLIERFGVEQYFLHTGAPDIFPADYLFNALNFILGCHPGSNTASFVSGVGAKSMTTAYGVNRADWSYIPGGVISGTALIRPDFPEMLDWPFLWQQAEYCLGRPTSDYIFLVLAADHLLNP
ncbi:MAG TPA: glycoside hydrolase family 9 protein [Lacunisphaera sp.]|nr:glycoside hydrolase family 9 protein [Lacunisphaera sp.]